MFFSFQQNKIATTVGTVFFTCAVGCLLAYKIVHIPLQFELVLLISLAALYPILRQPVIGIYCIFIIMPFIAYIRRLYYLLHQRPAADPLIMTGDILTALTLTGLFYAFKEKTSEHHYARIIKNCILFYFFYLLSRVIILNSQPPIEAFLRFRFYGPAVLLFFIGAHFAFNIQFLKHLWIITFIIGIIAALYGLSQLFFGYSDAEKLWFSNISFTTLFIKGLARPFSLFQSPAAFADYMQFAIIAILILYNMSTSSKRYLLLPIIFLFFYAALITSVRSNWIGIILSLIVWITVLTLRKKRTRIIAICCITGLFLFFQFFIDINIESQSSSLFQTFGGNTNQKYLDLLVTERTSALANPFEEYSFLSRINLWRYIIMLSADPLMALFGRGVGVFKADSLYFTYLAEFGYPGFIFIIWFTIYIIRTGFVTLDRTTDKSATTLIKGITLMNIVLAVVNITGTHIHSFPGDVFFWFWNGVLIEQSAQLSLNTNSKQSLNEH